MPPRGRAASGREVKSSDHFPSGLRSLIEVSFPTKSVPRDCRSQKVFTSRRNHDVVIFVSNCCPFLNVTKDRVCVRGPDSIRVPYCTKTKKKGTPRLRGPRSTRVLYRIKTTKGPVRMHGTKSIAPPGRSANCCR